jgi:hypothetical protein
MQVKVPSGISAVTSLRLLPRAPASLSMRLLLGLRRFAGTFTDISPVRYLPVSDFGFAMISGGVPSATIWPP